MSSTINRVNENSRTCWTGIFFMVSPHSLRSSACGGCYSEARERPGSLRSPTITVFLAPKVWIKDPGLQDPRNILIKGRAWRPQGSHCHNISFFSPPCFQIDNQQPSLFKLLMKLSIVKQGVREDNCYVRDWAKGLHAGGRELSCMQVRNTGESRIADSRFLGSPHTSYLYWFSGSIRTDHKIAQ